MVAAVGLVTILAWSALKPINQKNNFTRTMISSELQMLNVVDKPKDVLSISGATDHHIYFKTKNPSVIYETDNTLQNARYVNLNLNIPAAKVKPTMFNCFVDSPYTYIISGNARKILKIKPGDTTIVFNLPDAAFTRAAIISDNSVALRMFEKIDQIFSRVNITTGELQKEKGISEKNKDAGISTDGSLQYDKESNLLTYTFYGKNELLLLDTNLNLIKRVTINNMNESPVSNAGLTSDNTITNLKPKRMVNATSCTSKGYLYIESKLIADNELTEEFKQNSIIDVFNLKSKIIEGSFYIPQYNKKKMKDFRVANNLIIVVYEDQIVSYRLPFTIE